MGASAIPSRILSWLVAWTIMYVSYSLFRCSLTCYFPSIKAFLETYLLAPIYGLLFLLNIHMYINDFCIRSWISVTKCFQKVNPFPLAHLIKCNAKSLIRALTKYHWRRANGSVIPFKNNRKFKAHFFLQTQSNLVLGCLSQSSDLYTNFNASS